MGTRASIREVARQAQVSAMTVSNVIHGRDGAVSPETRDRVLAVMRALNYIPVRPALQNRREKTGTLGLIFARPNETAHSVAGDAFDGMRDAAMEHGYDLLMILRPQPQWAPDRKEVLFLDKRADGFIFMDPYTYRESLVALAKHEVPCVGCFNVDTPPGIAWVAPDNRAGVFQAVEHLRALGHRRVAHLSGPLWHTDARERAEAFREAMLQADCGDYADCIGNSNWGRDTSVLPDFLRMVRDRHVTAVCCANDYQALDLWAYAEEMGLRVPADLSIVGFDDRPEAAPRGLTTVANSFSNLGHCAVESLLRMIDGQGPAEACQRTPVRLVERESVFVRDGDKENPTICMTGNGAKRRRGHPE